jgi:hypothetical protein
MATRVPQDGRQTTTKINRTSSSEPKSVRDAYDRQQQGGKK